MSEDSLTVPPIRFATARDGTRLAYQDYGATSPVVVGIPPMAQNVEMIWELPQAREMFERFASFARWVQFDKRGTGCSDRRSHLPGIDERVDDLRTVMDAAGVERAHLFGQSEGGPTALLFAATYPHRVESVILFGSGARSIPDLEGEELAAQKERFGWFCSVWGTSESPVIDVFSPSMVDEPGYREWHARYERNAADSQSLLELLEISLDVDVGEALAEVSVPVLVVHRTGDLLVPVELGRDAASKLANATLVELDGDDHFGFAGDMHAWVDEVERFVTGTTPSQPPRRDRSTSTRIVTLGRFAVEVDGVEVPVGAWGSKQARQLCKRLVVARGRPVSREQLIDQLWPGEVDLRKLGSRLSVQLSAVRRILGGGIIADRETVALDLDEVSVDVEQLIAGPADDDATVSRYAGEFLPQDNDERWTQAVRSQASDVFRNAAQRRAAAAADAGDHDLAVDLHRRILALDRFDDAAHRRLLEQLIEAGDFRSAREAHGVWAEAMAEIDVEVEGLEQLLP